MIYQGQVLKASQHPHHRWVVLNDPQKCGGVVFFVNLTTLGDHCIDDACILDQADYSDLDHQTTVAYSKRHVGAASKVDAAIANRLFTILPDMPAQTIQKMIAGAKASDQVSDADKALL
jgi:hypothetical protein